MQVLSRQQSITFFSSGLKLWCLRQIEHSLLSRLKAPFPVLPPQFTHRSGGDLQAVSPETKECSFSPPPCYVRGPLPPDWRNSRALSTACLIAFRLSFLLRGLGGHVSFNHLTPSFRRERAAPHISTVLQSPPNGDVIFFSLIRQNVGTIPSSASPMACL